MFKEPMMPGAREEGQHEKSEEGYEIIKKDERKESKIKTDYVRSDSEKWEHIDSDLQNGIIEAVGDEFTVRLISMSNVLDEAGTFDAKGIIELVDKDGKNRLFDVEHHKKWGENRWHWEIRENESNEDENLTPEPNEKAGVSLGLTEELSPQQVFEEQERIERQKGQILFLADEIKALYEKIEDKTILEKYFNCKMSNLHNYVYAVFSGSEFFSQEKPYGNTIEEANTLLANISGKGIIDGITSRVEKQGFGDLKSSLSIAAGSLERLKEIFSNIGKMEGLNETHSSFTKIPPEMRAAVYQYDFDSSMEVADVKTIKADSGEDFAQITLRIKQEIYMDDGKMLKFPMPQFSEQKIYLKKVEGEWVLA